MAKKQVNARIFLYPLFILALLLCARSCGSPSDASLISKVVKLQSDRGSCTGEQVRAPSGETYILTAAHCRVLEQDGAIEAVTSTGAHIFRRVIAEDPASDLLLLEGLPKAEGLEIAEYAGYRTHVRTFTHGKGFPTYKTEGELVGFQQVQALLDAITDEASAARCSAPKLRIVNDGLMNLCILDAMETTTTAMIVPGSSGGPVVDDSGRLVGVVSAGDGTFGYLVRLSDIQAFLKAY